MATEETRKSAPRGGNLLVKLLVWSIVSTVIFTLIGLLIPRTYTATASLLFPGAHSSSGAASTGGTATDTGGSGGSDQPSLPLMQGVLSVPQPGTSPSTAYLILTSRKVTLELMNEFDLSRKWGLSRQRAIQRFNKRFICSVGNSGDLHIAFRDYDRERSIAVTEAAVEKLKALVKELSLDPAGKNAEVMALTLQQAEDDCAKDQAALIEFQRAIGGAAPDTQVQFLGQTYSEIQKNLIAAETEANAAAAKIRASTAVGEKMLRSNIDPQNSSNSLLTSLYRSVIDRRSELELLRQRYTDKHPDVVKARQAHTLAERDLNAEVKRQLASLQSGASPLVSEAAVTAFSTAARAAGLRKAAETTRTQLGALTEAQVKYGELSMKLRDDRSRLTLVRSEFVKAQLIEKSRGPQFVMLDTPDAPTKANEYEFYYFSLFGFGLAVVLVLVKELFSRIKTAMRSMGF